MKCFNLIFVELDSDFYLIFIIQVSIMMIRNCVGVFIFKFAYEAQAPENISFS